MLRFPLDPRCRANVPFALTQFASKGAVTLQLNRSVYELLPAHTYAEVEFAQRASAEMESCSSRHRTLRVVRSFSGGPTHDGLATRTRAQSAARNERLGLWSKPLPAAATRDKHLQLSGEVLRGNGDHAFLGGSSSFNSLFQRWQNVVIIFLIA